MAPRKVEQDGMGVCVERVRALLFEKRAESAQGQGAGRQFTEVAPRKRCLLGCEVAEAYLAFLF